MVDTTVEKCLQTHFFYVDNRPISLQRDPGKHLLKLIRQQYPTNTSHSFIYVNIHCSSSVIYDCNLDPAKSEIIFERLDYIAECFSQFLEQCQMTTSGSVNLGEPAQRNIHGEGGFPSPPLTSPVKTVRDRINVYAVDEGELYPPLMKQSPEMVTRRGRCLTDHIVKEQGHSPMPTKPSLPETGISDLTDMGEVRLEEYRCIRPPRNEIQYSQSNLPRNQRP